MFDMSNSVHQKFNDCSFSSCHFSLKPSHIRRDINIISFDQARKLGVILDSPLFLLSHVQSLKKYCCLHLLNGFRTWLFTTAMPTAIVWTYYNFLMVNYCNQFSSVAQSCLTLQPMDYSMPGLPVYHQLPEFTQTHVHWVSDAIQPSHPLSSPSPPAFNISQH